MSDYTDRESDDNTLAGSDNADTGTERTESVVDSVPGLDARIEGTVSDVEADTDAYLAAADGVLADQFDEALTFTEYIDTIFAHPAAAAHSTKYLVQAIEAMGTRTVVEEGEERTRYRFFDDPANDGEHAILGNTEMLNDFVEDLKSIASDRGKTEGIIWFSGPTATGKSELKRCLINGLHAFSKTDAGRRYTVEWNLKATRQPDRDPLTYGESGSGISEEDWVRSPVQAHPLTVLPEGARTDVLRDLNAADPSPIRTRVDGALTPFSREMFTAFADAHRDEQDIFSKIVTNDYLRVTNFTVEEGQGIGVLHAEDDGSAKERLVGSWMPGMLRELNSRGRKNPQAFSYDGVLSQGNGLLTIVEDATQHSDLLQNLLNVPDERRVKLDKGIGMDVDTQIIVISNPDLEAELDKYEDRQASDPLKALKRRLTKYSFRYLVNVSLEAQLLWRELTNSSELWTMQDESKIQANVRAPLTVTVEPAHTDSVNRTVTPPGGAGGSKEGGRGAVVERELAPHTIEAAALYDVVSRLDAEMVPDSISIVENALLFDQGYIRDGDERLEKDDFEWDAERSAGENGIPVTYTRDVIADLLSEPTERSHESLPVENVILPSDVLNAMSTAFTSAPVFSGKEAARYDNLLVDVKEYVREAQVDDVQAAMLREVGVTQSAVEEYVTHVFAWGTDESFDTNPGRTDIPDPVTMKLFETDQLGRFDDADYTGNTPKESVTEFRENQIIAAVNRALWQERDSEFSVDDIDYWDIPALDAALNTQSWDDVQSQFEDFDPAQWADPQEGTETATVKEETIANMTEMFGYSEASAELVSRAVITEVRYQWD